MKTIRQVVAAPRLPTLRELKRFCDTGECTEYASWIERELKRYKLKRHDGAYRRTDGRLADHAWVVAPDGTIIDTTHGQFDRHVPILIAPPGSPEHARYLDVDDMTDEQRRQVYGPE